MLRRMSDFNSSIEGCEASALSSREREVLTLLGSGYKPAAIAAQMCVSIRTIESYAARIRQKLNIGSSSELILAAVAWMRSQPV